MSTNRTCNIPGIFNFKVRMKYPMNNATLILPNSNAYTYV